MDALVETEVNQITQASAFEVKSPEDLTKATLVLKGIKGLMDKVKEMLDPIVDKAYKAHKEATAQRNKYLDPLKQAETKLKGAILSYNARLEDERRKAEEAANKKLAEEAEAKKKKLLAQAEEADEWTAETLKEQAAEIKPNQVIVEGQFQKQEGLSIRKAWKARIIDINLVPRDYLIIEPNMSALNGHARVNKNLIPIAGVEFYEESSASIRS